VKYYARLVEIFAIEVTEFEDLDAINTMHAIHCATVDQRLQALKIVIESK